MHHRLAGRALRTKSICDRGDVVPRIAKHDRGGGGGAARRGGWGVGKQDLAAVVRAVVVVRKRTGEEGHEEGGS